ncbi:MAG: glycerophosphodiester phosphodiesterase [Chloroflexi bacterium]|nr:glycerophosphodiester phosphodiesterase [Chloroflexota bacterium]
MPSFTRGLLAGGAAGIGAVAARRALTGWRPESLDEMYGGRRLPLIFGHRGASGVAPENTLLAFQTALDQGADGIELDAQLSADGQVVAIHDATLDRTTNGHGLVGAHTLAQLKALDASSWFRGGDGAPASHSDCRIPTLTEVFDLVRGTRAIVNVEIKTDQPLGERRLVSAVVEAIARSGLNRQVLLSSFNPISLWHLRRLDPRLPIALLYSNDQPLRTGGRWAEPLVRPNALNPTYRMATPEHVAAAHARGQRVNVWTVNEEADLRRAAAAGVDGVITNYPDRALRVR